jgi:hypothetical protein
MDTEYTGPVEIEGYAEFPESGLWNVHGHFRVQARYANGMTMDIADTFPNGIRFIGHEDWIFVSRDATSVTSSDSGVADVNREALEASNLAILESVIGPNEIQFTVAKNSIEIGRIV